MYLCRFAPPSSPLQRKAIGIQIDFIHTDTPFHASLRILTCPSQLGDVWECVTWPHAGSLFPFLTVIPFLFPCVSALAFSFEARIKKERKERKWLKINKQINRRKEKSETCSRVNRTSDTRKTNRQNARFEADKRPHMRKQNRAGHKEERKKDMERTERERRKGRKYTKTREREVWEGGSSSEGKKERWREFGSPTLTLLTS